MALIGTGMWARSPRIWAGPARVVPAADVDDVGVVVLQMASGSLASVTGSYVSPPTFAIRLSGSEAVLDDREDFCVWPAVRRLDSATTLAMAGEPVAVEERGMLAEELARCVRAGATPETGAAEGVAALRPLRAALEAGEGDRSWQPAPR